MLSWFDSLEVKTKFWRNASNFEVILSPRLISWYQNRSAKLIKAWNPLLSSVFLLVLAVANEGRPRSIFASSPPEKRYSFPSHFLSIPFQHRHKFFEVFSFFLELIYLSNFLWSGFSFVCDVSWWLFWSESRL